MSNKIKKIGLAEYKNQARLLSYLIANTIDVDIIYALTRGGMMFAYYLAEKTGCRDIRTVCISSYGQDNKKKQVEVHYVAAPDDGNIVLVDDLVDSGETMQLAKQLIQDQIDYCCTNSELYTASLYHKPHSKFKSDFEGMQVDNDIWLEFYYE